MIIDNVELLLRVISLTKQLEKFTDLDPLNKTWVADIELSIIQANGKTTKTTIIEDPEGLETIIESFEKRIEELENEKNKIS